MQLLVRLGGARGLETHMVDIEPTAPVADLIEGLVAATGEQGPWWLARTGTQLAPSSPVSELRLRHGDALVSSPSPPASVPGPRRTGGASGTLTLSEAKHPGRAGAAAGKSLVLRVVGGPSAGATAPVPHGGVTVGRVGGGADVQLDDQAVSRHHLTLKAIPGGGIVLRDEGSTNGTCLDGRPVPPRQDVTVRSGAAIGLGSSTLVVESGAGAAAAATYRDGALQLNRPARVIPTAPNLVVRLPTPPVAPGGRGLPLASALAPLAVGVGGAVILRRPEMLLFAAMSPVMVVSSVISERRSGRGAHRKAEAAFAAALAEAARTAEEAHAASTLARRDLAPDLAVLIERAAGPDARLWERSIDDPDALALRVGTGTLPTLVVHQEDDGPAGRPLAHAAPPPGAAKVQELRKAYALEPDVPVVVPLVEDGVLGVAGTPAKADALARALVAQVATLHSPAQVELAALVVPTRADGWSWLSWLPHTELPESGDVGERAVATTAAGARVLLQRLADLIRMRSDGVARRVGAWSGPRTVVVVVGDVDVPRPTLAAVLRDGPEVGVHAIVVAATVEELPGECGAVVELGFDSATLLRVRRAETVPAVVADGLGAAAALDLALHLAPIRDAAAARRGGDLPSAANLLDLAGLQPPSSGAVAQRWEASSGGLGAPIGISTAGVLDVDLRSDGPHALVAGTTGAGKSELLQTWVASLAAHHPPERLTFVLVDYKGGAAFGVCESLPHVVGFVTDLDGRLALRALESLNAELRRREHIITVEHRCGDLKALEEKRPDVVLPSLFLVFDEFAFLRKEVPEFVDGIIDIAQRGRSLGVHLALATQRPAGVVDDKIKANVDLRIALRVADPQDSSDVIDVKDAARIPKARPGRGYVRRGAGTQPQPFQAAYVGARRPEGPSRAPVRVKPLAVVDAPTPTPTARRPAAPAGERHPTDLERLVGVIGEAWARRGAPPPVRPWTEPLAWVIDLASLGSPARPASLIGRLAAPIGLVDLPSVQAQRPWWADLDGNLAVYGAGGSGRSTLVRTLVAGLITELAPDALWLYGIDAGSRGLDPLVPLPHCGGVVPIGDLERVERVVTVVDQIVLERRARAATGPWGVAGQPYVLLLVENYGGFVDAVRDVNHGAMADRLERIIADGRSVGVHVLLTADRRGAVPTAVAGVVANQIVLRLASDDEYSWLGLGRAAAGASGFPPGRGLVDGATELQVAVAGGRGTAEQAAALSAIAGRCGQGRSAVPVEVLAEVVPRSSLPPAPGPLRLPLGLDGASLLPAVCALDLVPSFLVCGPDGTGRSTALATIALAATAADPSLEAYLFAPRKTPLIGLSCWKEVARGADACQQLATLLAVEVQDRVREEGRPFLVVVDDGEQLIDGLVATHLETVVKKGRDLPALVVAAVQTHAVRRAFSGWLPEVRNAKHGLLLLPDITTDGDLLGVQLPRKQVRSWPAGRGYMVRRGQVQLVQVAS